MRAVTWGAAIALLFAACDSQGEPGQDTPAGDSTASPARSPSGDGSCDVLVAYSDPEVDRPRYTIDMKVDPKRRLVTGDLTVDFTPDLDTDRLVFRLWPNGPSQAAAGAHLEVDGVRVENKPAQTHMVAPTTLLVPVEGGLEAGETVSASMRWRLDVPGPVLDRLSVNGSAVRLGSFFPLLPWVAGQGWATDPPPTSLAEASSSPTADFDVTVAAPKGLDILASGEGTDGHFRATTVRDFALAIGRFEKVTATVNAPDPVTVTVGVETSLEASAQDFLEQTTRALEVHSERYGSYPWTTFSMAVMPDLGRSGIEYPTLVFQGPDSLQRATTHEVGHSWFYSLVGNNQARDPWLDEGLTTWSQARGDNILPFLLDVEPGRGARDHLGAPMAYWDRHYGDYFAGVYAQGVRALAALGPPAEVDCALRAYIAANAYGIAEPSDLVDALDDFFPHARKTLKRFGARF